MASEPEKPTLFLRKASGLAREWSLFDAFAFQSWLSPLIAGSYIFTYAYVFPAGNLVIAIFLLLAFATFECLVYAMMVPTMPRVGGDYIWQSRILHPLVGFVVMFVGWCIVLQMWIPIYDVVYVDQYYAPLAAMYGNVNLAYWLMGQNGIFVTSIISTLVALAFCSFGMKAFAKLLRLFLYLSLAGAVVVMIVLPLYSHAAFVSGYNAFAHNVLGYNGTNNYQDTISAAQKAGIYAPIGYTPWNIAASLPLVSLVTFWGIYSIWSAPMYGEVRGAESVKKTFYSFIVGDWPLGLMTVAIMLFTYNVASYDFYNAASGAFWSGLSSVTPLQPSPAFWVYILTGNAPLTAFILISTAVMLLLLSGGENYFLISRFLFAMSFDRVLPAFFAKLHTRNRIPGWTYLYITIITVIFSWLYAYNVYGFSIVTLDGTVTLSLGFTVTALAALLLPYRRKDLFNASPASNYMVGGIPLITICGAGWFFFSLWYTYYWVVDARYGVNNPVSAIFLVFCYAATSVFFVVYRWYRKRQGIDVDMIFREIPGE